MKVKLWKVLLVVVLLVMCIANFLVLEHLVKRVDSILEITIENRESIRKLNNPPDPPKPEL